ncbi:Cu2+-exporting ATPase [Constrictibacter sp. MBR-5]|uniref:heavy metal translocating P-type ATPase n=1 Tax=Constrictibacter sp. MBR-5 TaxID=3156467 RepID=UPI003393A106
MSCCAFGAVAAEYAPRSGWPSDQEIRLASRTVGEDLLQTDLSVPSAHCGGCIAAIEAALTPLEGVVSARLNLTTRRATVKWRKAGKAPPLFQALAAAGYDASLFSLDEPETNQEMRRLVRATAVAGFGAFNIMLFSVSVWSGAGEGTRHLFHILSAVLAVPVVLYSGRVFFLSAWSAAKSGRANMDVPISVGILFALALSLHDTLRNNPHAYFDAVTSLIFFLLAGRTLDHMMRSKARTAVLGLARMMPRGAAVVAPDGEVSYKPLQEIAPQERVLVAPGERIPLDGVVASGSADVDAAIVTGEAASLPVKPGSSVLAGMLNLDGSLEVTVTRPVADSFVASIARLMEAAEHGRAKYRRLADRAASAYSPFVHALAMLAFVGWMTATGDWHRSLTVAISVLIITCPCALGLAVPMAQVMAARRLFERGIALKDGSGLERLAEVDTVVFDKTGTLTLGDPRVTDCSVPHEHLAAAAALAARSRHPAARAVAALAEGRLDVEEFREQPGLGIEGRIGSNVYRLGKAEWVRSQGEASHSGTDQGSTLTCNGEFLGSFSFSDTPRLQARQAVNGLRAAGLEVEMLSGDRREPVSRMAAALGIAAFRSGLLPQGKVTRLEELARNGRRTLMVGDGLNDAPALSAAHVSMAPGNAADIGRAAADLVFFGRGLMAVPDAIAIAATARRLVHQNLALAIAYNVLVIPVALLGYVTPLMAAVAMSLSSILVVANALRFPSMRGRTVASEGPGAPVPIALEAAR